MNNKRFIVSIIEIVVGISLIIGSFMGVDEYWSGMGTAFLVVGILNIIRVVKYKKNDEYREKWDIEVNDERNKYLRLKSWAWAGYLFVMSGGIGTIGFKLAGKEDLMKMASYSVCYIMILFWISNIFLRKKY